MDEDTDPEGTFELGLYSFPPCEMVDIVEESKELLELEEISINDDEYVGFDNSDEPGGVDLRHEDTNTTMLIIQTESRLKLFR